MSAEIKIAIDAYTQSDSLKTANTELEKMLKHLQDISKVQGSKVKANNNISEITKEINEQKKVTVEIEKKKAAVVALTIEEQKNRAMIAEKNRMSKIEAQLANATKGSYAALSAELAKVTVAFRKINLESKTVSRSEMETINRRKQLIAQLKQIDATQGVHTRNVGNYSSALDGLKGKFLEITAGLAAFAGAFAFLKKGWESFLEAEHNAKQLSFAIKNVGGEGELAFKGLMEQSQELQKNGIFSDDAIQKAQTQLANYGLSSDAIKKLIPQITDMAAATGKDLGEATDIVIKGINGQTKGLKMLGIDYKATGDKAQNLALMTDQLTKFQGANAAQMDTVAGKTERLKNVWDDFMENVGEVLVNHADSALTAWEIISGKKTLQEMADGKVFNAYLSAFTNMNLKLQDELEKSTGVVQGANAKAKISAQIVEYGNEINRVIKLQQKASLEGNRELEHTYAVRLRALDKASDDLRKVYSGISETKNNFEKDETETSVVKKHVEDLWSLRLRLMKEGREKELLANQIAYNKEYEQEGLTLKEKNLLIDIYQKQEDEINKKWDDLALKRQEEFYIAQKKLIDQKEKEKQGHIESLRSRQSSLLERNTTASTDPSQIEEKRYQDELDKLETMKSDADAWGLEQEETYQNDLELIKKHHAEIQLQIEKEKQDSLRKEVSENLQQIGDMVADAAIKQSDRKLEINAREQTRNDEMIDTQRRRAELGLSNDLAFEEKRRAELDRAAMAEQKKQEKIKKLQAYWTLFTKFAESDGDQAAQKALLELAEGIAISAMFAEKGGMGEDLKDSTSLGSNGWSKSHNSGDMLTMISPKEGILTEQNIAALGGKEGFYDLKHNLETMANNPISDDLFAKQNESFSNIALQKVVNVNLQPLEEKIEKLIEITANKPVSTWDVDGLGNYIHTLTKLNSRIITDKGSFIRQPRKKFID